MSAVPYRPFPNQFRADLRAGKRLIGCWASLAAPTTAEILGLAGFDWILLDGEHSPNDVTTFVPQLMALKGSPSAPVVRPPWNEPVIIKRLLDIGFHNFLLPYVETADQARNAVASTRYPPQGIRGVSIAHRSNMYGTVQGYFPDINDNITVLLQIETRKGLEAVDAVDSGDFVDCLKALAGLDLQQHRDVVVDVGEIALHGPVHVAAVSNRNPANAVGWIARRCDRVARLIGGLDIGQ